MKETTCRPLGPKAETTVLKTGRRPSGLGSVAADRSQGMAQGWLPGWQPRAHNSSSSVLGSSNVSAGLPFLSHFKTVTLALRVVSHREHKVRELVFA
jgi:hypothetical protein